MHCRAHALRSNPPRAFLNYFFLKNWRDLDFYEQKFQETEKFHVRKVKCLVRATERKMSVWRMETSDDREEKHHWSTLGCRLLSRTVFSFIIHSKWSQNNVPSAWWPLNRGDNNGRIQLGVMKRWPRLNRGGRLKEVQFPILFFNYFGTLITGRAIGDRLMKVQQ